MAYRAGVLTVSDGCARGEREDVSGQVLADRLAAHGYELAARAVVPDEANAIESLLRGWCAGACDLVLTTGGTGFSPRDVTPEAARRVFERDAPGLAELLRWTGYQKFPRAVLSRGVAGVCSRTLIVTLPGSPGGVRDGLEVLLPLLPHALALLRDEPVDHTPGNTAGAQFVAPAPEAAPAIQNPKSKIQNHPPTTVAVLETNLDDMPAEWFEAVTERLMAAGALDVFLTPIQMKKNRPGTLLTVLCAPERAEEMAGLLFRETTTFGVRRTTWERYVLERRWVTVETEFGPVRVKVGSWRGADTTAAPEYADVRAASERAKAPIKDVYRAAQRAYDAATNPPPET